jgi:hypothetical protein
MPQSQRAAQPPQDFQKMCKQAERDHESKKLTVLMERVKRQLEERNGPFSKIGAPKPPIAVIAGEISRRPPSRSAIFER